MPERIFNFAAGPCTLPLDALKKAQAEFVNYADSGMSLFEMSHRGKIYDGIHCEAIALLREVYGIPENFKILLLGGGATLQFAMIPYNFLKPGEFAQYVMSGTWAKKAYDDAKLLGDARIVASSKEQSHTVFPKGYTVDPAAAYLHITTNNTIEGTELRSLPDAGNVPIFADMSSDFLSYAVDWSKIGIAYGGAQKNLGPAGMAVVIIRDDILAKHNKALPAYLRYDLHADNNSMYNTPPMFPIYMMKLTLDWVKAQGGLKAMDQLADRRAGILYGAIDNNSGYYRCPVAKEDRSRMNVVFRLPTEELEALFIAEAKKRGMSELKGHRSVGGCRASLYNAMPVAGVEALAAFMVEFMKAHPV